MAYSPENNPYIPGDPYSYDLKWLVKKVNEWKDPEDSAERAKASAEAAAASAEAADLSAQASSDSADASADSAADSKYYADHIADPVSGIVTAWLADNITQPTTPAIDASLTIAGAAADAKAAGDGIRDAIKSSHVYVTAGNVSSYNDINNYPANSIIAVAPAVASQVTPRPYGANEGFTIITSGMAGTPGSVPYGGEIQIAIPLFANAKSILYRSYNGSNWTNWSPEYSRTAINSSGILVNQNNVANYNDIDAYPINKIIAVVPAVSDQVAHRPFESGGFTIISTGYSYLADTVPFGGEIQIAIPTFAGTSPIKYRSYDGVNFSPWRGSGIYYATPSNFMDTLDIALGDDGAVVYMEPGTYDLFTSTYDETFWKNRRPATRYCGINLKSHIHIIGQGDGVIINARYTGSDADIKENFSAFNIAGSCILENVTIEGENICYLIHDDPLIVSEAYVDFKMINCQLHHYGSDHTFQFGAPTCYGGGEALATSRRLEGNIFTADQYAYPVSIHTMTAASGYYVFANNVLTNGTIRFTIFGDGTGKITAIATQNFLKSAMEGTTLANITVYENNIIY